MNQSHIHRDFQIFKHHRFHFTGIIVDSFNQLSISIGYLTFQVFQYHLHRLHHNQFLNRQLHLINFLLLNLYQHPLLLLELFLILEILRFLQFFHLLFESFQNYKDNRRIIEQLIYMEFLVVRLCFISQTSRLSLMPMFAIIFLLLFFLSGALLFG